MLNVESVINIVVQAFYAPSIQEREVDGFCRAVCREINSTIELTDEMHTDIMKMLLEADNQKPSAYAYCCGTIILRPNWRNYKSEKNELLESIVRYLCEKLGLEFED